MSWKGFRLRFAFLRMLRISISFPSGSGKTLELDELSKVKDLKLLAQRSFGRGFLKFVPAKGHVLTNPADSLQAAGIQDGEHLTAVAQDGKLIAANKAFALWCCGGNSVVTWGNPHSGGSCSAILAGQSKTRLDSSLILLLPARNHSGSWTVVDCCSTVAWTIRIHSNPFKIQI